MLLKLIACEVFTREICHCLATAPHVVNIEFTEKGAHDRSGFLRDVIQSKIDSAQKAEKKYDAMLLCLGLCGNAAVNLFSRGFKVVIPRAHDCGTLFLGSKERYEDFLAENPSLSFSSAGYVERDDSYVMEASVNKTLGLDKSYEQYVQLYGEENAKFIWENLDPCRADQQSSKVVFIKVPETEHLGYAEQCRAKAQAEGKQYVQLQGNIRLIKSLVLGDWNQSEFLIMQPYQRTSAVYDWEEIIRAEDEIKT